MWQKGTTKASSGGSPVRARRKKESAQQPGRRQRERSSQRSGKPKTERTKEPRNAQKNYPLQGRREGAKGNARERDAQEEEKQEMPWSVQEKKKRKKIEMK